MRFGIFFSLFSVFRLPYGTRQCAVISHIGLRIGGAMMVWMEICVDGGRLERLDTGSSGGLLMRIMQDKIAI